MKVEIEDVTRRRTDWLKIGMIASWVLLAACFVWCCSLLGDSHYYKALPTPALHGPVNVLRLDEWEIASVGTFRITCYDTTEDTMEGGKFDRLKRPLRNRAVCAVDPNVIPFGSLVLIEGLGLYSADDCSAPRHEGGMIHGYRIDVLEVDRSKWAAITRQRRVCVFRKTEEE